MDNNNLGLWGLDWRAYVGTAITRETRLSPKLQKRETTYEFSTLLIKSILSAEEEIANGTITGRFSSADELIESLREDE